MGGYLLTTQLWKVIVCSAVIIFACTPRINCTTGIISTYVYYSDVRIHSYVKLLPIKLLIECSIEDDRSLTDFDYIKPNSSLSGYFSYPISCDGRVTSVKASGFCFIPNPNVPVVLFLGVTTFRSNGFSFSHHIIPANCATQINGSDYHAGSISADDVGIQVSSGNLLSVRFNSTCLDGVCLFQPAIVNESTNYNFTFYDGNLKPLDVGSISLLFSATIISGMI